MSLRRSFAVLAVLATALAIVPVHASHAPPECRPLLLFGPIFGQGEECPGHPEPPREPVPLSGNAFGVHVRNLKVLGTPVGTPPPLPSVTLPAVGGSFTANLIGGTFGPVTADVLRVSTEGDLFQSYSLSSAHTARVGISVGTLSIEATAVRAVAYCHGHGPDDRGPVGFDGQPVDPATLGSLTIDIGSGPVTISVLPLPNTWIPIPGVGGIMLREQWNLGGGGYQHFTENMIHVYLLGGPVTGEIIVSSAHCDGFTDGKKFVEQDRHGERIEIEF